MSLQVWLPLNGDLHDQGLLGITATNNGATLNDNGKIGKCYNFTGSNSISINTVVLPSQTPAWSFACWFNLSDVTTTTAECLFSERGGGGNANGYTIFLYPKTGQILVDDGVRWTVTPMTYTENTWYHFVVTRDSTGKKIYINGVLKSSTTTIGNTTAINNNGCLIGLAQSGAALITGNQGWKGKLNDVRIYNHSLSAKEVEELSKGLVLHYKLDSINLSVGNENLLHKSTVNNRFGATNELTTLTFSGWDNYCPVHLTDIDWNSHYGDYITYTCYLNNIEQTAGTGTGIMLHFRYADGTYQQFGGGKNGNTGSYFAQGESGWLKLTIAIPNASTRSNPTTINYVEASIRHNSSGGASTIQYQYPKVEVGTVQTPWDWAPDDGGSISFNVVYDCSGYNNNGTVVGSVTNISDTARYGTSLNFASGQYIFSQNRVATFLPTDQITVNLWGKFNSYATNLISCTESGGWNFENSGGCLQFPVYIESVGYKIAKATTTVASMAGAWHMVTGVFDGANIKIYIDGLLETTTATGSTNGIHYANTFLGLACEVNTKTTPANSNYVGQISDCRIYATALNDEQILELYNTSMTIDKNGNGYVREVIEDSKLNVTKTGQFHGSELLDDDIFTTASITKIDKQLKVNTLYEY